MTARFVSAVAGSALLLLYGAAIAQERQGEHSMEGEITSINKETGEVDVNTEPVPMKLHFPAEAARKRNGFSANPGTETGHRGR